MNASTTQQNLTPSYQESTEGVLAALETDALQGLSEAEASTRLERFGSNELAAEEPVPGWRKVVAQFTNVLVILLLVASAISFALLLIRTTPTQPTPPPANFSYA